MFDSVLSITIKNKEWNKKSKIIKDFDDYMHGKWLFEQFFNLKIDKNEFDILIWKF